MAENQTLTNKEIALKRFKGESLDPIITNDDTAEQERLEKEKADAETERLRLEAEAKSKNAPHLPDLSDDELFEIMAKKAGRKISSWDELKPKAEEVDKEKLAEQRESDKISFGLKNGLFNKNQFEGFLVDSKDKTGVVYKAELQEAKKNDPDWTSEKESEFKAEFDAEYGIDQDDTSAKKKRGQRKLDILANTILKNTYSSIYELDDKYGKHESEAKAKFDKEQKILNGAPIYKKEVAEIVSSFSDIEMPFGANETYKVPVSKEILQSVNDLLLNTDFVVAQIEKGYSKSELAEVAKNIIISQNLPTLVQEVAKQYRAKHEKGVRGIPPSGDIEKEDNGLEGLSDNQKKAITFFKISEKPVNAN